MEEINGAESEEDRVITKTVLTVMKQNGEGQICPLVREGAPHQQTRNCLTVAKMWSWARDGCLTPRQTGRLTIGRNITLSLILVCEVVVRWSPVCRGVSTERRETFAVAKQRDCGYWSVYDTDL
jgi:hypothetical protein